MASAAYTPQLREVRVGLFNNKLYPILVLMFCLAIKDG